MLANSIVVLEAGQRSVAVDGLKGEVFIINR
jgi:hypothetical protein